MSWKEVLEHNHSFIILFSLRKLSMDLSPPCGVHLLPGVIAIHLHIQHDGEVDGDFGDMCC